MALFEIATLGSFAKLLLAARKLAEDGDPLNRLKALADLAENGSKLRAALGERNLGPLAARIETECEKADAAFAREPLIEEARNLFRDAAPVALAECDALAGRGLEQVDIVHAMVKAVDASDFARALRETPLPEIYFRAVMTAALKAMLADTAFIHSLNPQLWRESLRRQGVTIELLDEMREDQRREAERAAVRHQELLAHLRASQETIRLAEAGVTEEALIALAKRIADNVDNLGDAWTELQGAIEVAIRVQEEGRHGSNLGGFVDEVLRRVADLSAQGDHDEAAAEIDGALAAAEAEHKARTLRLLEAGLEQDRLRRNAGAAARRELRKLEAETGRPLAFETLRALREDWRLRGRDKGVPFDQEVSVELARIAVAEAGGKRELGLAMTDLGTSLREFGDRQANPAWLEEAVTAHRAALAHCPRELAPQDWAETQMCLGSALLTLGEREQGTSRMAEAVSACRLALEEWTREREPQKWALAQMNLGVSLATLGSRETGRAELDDAIVAYRAALEVWTRAQSPLDWARAQRNLGLALGILGERKSNAVMVQDSANALRAALKEMTRARMPLDWAATKSSLGNTLAVLGGLEDGTARLEEAIEAHKAALMERKREKVPMEWARGQGNLASVEMALFDKNGDQALLDAAEERLRAAREIFLGARADHLAEIADQQLAEILVRRKRLAG